MEILTYEKFYFKLRNLKKKKKKDLAKYSLRYWFQAFSFLWVPVKQDFKRALSPSFS